MTDPPRRSSCSAALSFAWLMTFFTLGGRVILIGGSASRRPICKLVSSNDSQIFSKRSQKLGCLVPTLLFQRALKKDQINFQLVINIIHLNTHFQLSTALLVRTSLPNTDSTSRRWMTQVFSIYVFNCLNLPLYPCPTSTENIFSWAHASSMRFCGNKGMAMVSCSQRAKSSFSR